MSFNFMLKSSSAKGQPLQIRKEVVTAVVQNSKLARPKLTGSNGKATKISTRSPAKPSRQSRKRATPSLDVVRFTSDDSEVDQDGEAPRKKLRQEPRTNTDPSRQVRSQQAFTEGEGIFPMVHGADIVSLDKATKYIPSFDGLSEDFEVLLQYPSASQRER